MASNTRVVNITNGCRYPRSWVERAINEFAVGWVERGVSCRRLTGEEAAEARKQAERREYLTAPLPYAEIPGTRFDPPTSGVAATRRESYLMWQAHDFVMSQAA